MSEPFPWNRQSRLPSAPDGSVNAPTAIWVRSATDTPADVQEIVLKANEDRHSRFITIAETRGAPLSVVELVAGKKFIAETAPGEFVQNDKGTWVRKP